MTAPASEHLDDCRADLRAHCYRMLGSTFDADDAVRETLLRAWRAVERFEGRTALRGWLYRIATNVCLTVPSKEKRKRLTPFLSGPPAGDYSGAIDPEVSWLEPYPTPDEAFEAKEATELAFVAAIAYLPARQRAALLLTDVLGWPAAETGAHARLVRRGREQRAPACTRGAPRNRAGAGHGRAARAERELLTRYIEAWHEVDIGGLAALLRNDAVFSMLPRPHWYRGRDPIRGFLTWAIAQTGFAQTRLVPARANGQPAAVFCGRENETEPCQPHAIDVLTVDQDEIADVHAFMDARLVALFAADPPHE